MTKVPVAVLASGSGTNLGALITACSDPAFPAAIVRVVSDRPRAGALDRARAAGIETAIVTRREHADRDAFDQALVQQIQASGASWVCLAGFMRIVGGGFLGAFPGRVLNIHPSLLPAFPGLDVQAEAFDYGVRIAGCTVHLVDHGTDTGPIVAQGAVPVFDDDDAHTVQQRILRMEHQLYPRALRWAVEGRLSLEGRRLRVRGPEVATFQFDPRR